MKHVRWAVLAFVIVALAVRLTVRDELPALYYATPPLVLAVMAAAARGRLGAVLAVACFGWHATTSFEWNAPAPGTLRVASWNAGRGNWGADPGSLEADVVGLVESPTDPRFTQLGGGLAIRLDGTIHEWRRFDLDGRGRAAIVRATVKGAPLTIVLVDMKANPLRSRRPAFEALERELPKTGPLIVMGDFNTPRDSTYFDSWRPEFTHAFEAAGRGLDATWPTPAPLLSIDHVWCRGLTATSCEQPWTLASDHRPVVVELTAP